MYRIKRPNKIKVDVTMEDIAAGRRKACGGCPLAIAISRVIGKECVVGPVCWWIDGDYRQDCQKLMREPLRFRENFDDGLPVQPFSFYIERW